MSPGGIPFVEVGRRENYMQINKRLQTIFGVEEFRMNRIRRFHPVIRSQDGWWLGAKVSFIFDVPREEIDPDWYMDLVPDEFTPEVWLHVRKNLYTLRVPIKFSKKARKLIYQRGFRYNSNTGLWKKSLWHWRLV